MKSFSCTLSLMRMHCNRTTAVSACFIIAIAMVIVISVSSLSLHHWRAYLLPILFIQY